MVIRLMDDPIKYTDKSICRYANINKKKLLIVIQEK